MPDLQEELKKRRPFESSEQEATLNLMRTNDFVQIEFCRLFKRHGISSPQYNVLRILRGTGPTGLPSLEISARMITRVPDVTRLVDRLEAAGLVDRCRIKQDRRVVLVRITSKGLALLEGLDEPLMTLHQQQLQHLTREELAELNRLLVKARQRA